MTAFYKQSWFAPVASAATNFLFPSLGGSIGGAVNSVLGGAMSEGVANALGSAIVGGGIGGLSSGGTGALTGALSGGLTRGLMDYTGYNQGLSGLINNGSFSLPNGTPNAVAAGARDSNIAATNGVTGGNAGAAAAATGKTASGGGMGALSNPALIAGLALAGSMGSSLMGQKQAQSGPPTTTTDPNMTRGLSQVAFNRTYQAPQGDLTRYGMTGGQHRFYDDNRLPATVAARDGGYLRRYAGGGGVRSESAEDEVLARRRAAMAQQLAETARVRERGAPLLGPAVPGSNQSSMPAFMNWIPGALDQHSKMYAKGGVSGPGAGRSDDIPAVLSDGEYVIDAETVALLGDGSSKAGAAKLDQMRQQIRKHKGGALARGQISPDAKPALAYAGGK